jgi:hypothetical protein
VGHVLRYSGLFHMETILARVSQSGLKTDGGATAGGRGGCVGVKLKMDGSMRWTASNPVTLVLPFLFY